MRQSTLLLLTAVQLATIACQQGHVRKYDPLRRVPETTATPPPANEKETSPAAPAASVPTPMPIPVVKPLETVVKDLGTNPTIVDRAWCRIREEQPNFVVERYVFSGGTVNSTRFERLDFNPQRPPLARAGQSLERWMETNLTRTVPDAGTIGVEPLNADVAQATPDFQEQGQLFDKMVTGVEIAVSDASLGDDGAIRLSRPGKPEQILFDCQNYSPTFVALRASAKALTPPAPVPAPVDPATKGFASALRAPFAPLPVAAAQIPRSRWCSYQKVQDDVVIGILQFGPKRELTLSHLRTSLLKGDKPGKRGFAKASVHAPKDATITSDKGSRLTTSEGRSYRLLTDAADTRAIVLDSGADAAAPLSSAEVFFECSADHDPIQDAAINQNLGDYMSLRYR